MPISLRCPSCAKIHTVGDHMKGRRVRCPSCDAMMAVAEENEATEAELAALARASSGDLPDLIADQTTSGGTIMLEAVDVIELMAAANIARKPAQPTPDDETIPLKKPSLVETEMDMTPMVDVTFQMLIFFMITAAFALQKSLEVPKPKTDAPSTQAVVEPDEKGDSVTVGIDEFNTFTVTTIDWEEEATGIHDLQARLRKARGGDSTGKVPTTLRVEPHDDSMHEKVVAAIDSGMATGFSEIELAKPAADDE